MTKDARAADLPRHRSLPAGGIMVLLQLITGCSSWLDIDEKAETNLVAGENPEGIVLNRPQVYQIKISIDPSGFCKLAEPLRSDCHPALKDTELAGVDQRHLLIVNARRMPFSSATLSMSTYPSTQLVQEIKLESATGAASVPAAASAALEAKAERADIKQKAKEKEEQAKEQEGGS